MCKAQAVPNTRVTIFESPLHSHCMHQCQRPKSGLRLMSFGSDPAHVMIITYSLLGYPLQPIWA